MSDISKLLSTDGYIPVNKYLIKLLGLNAAVLIGELCREYNYWADNGDLVEDSFFSTRENIKNNTGLTDYAQREALEVLNRYNIVSVVKRGIPATNYYMIDFDELTNLFSCAKSNDKTFEIERQDLTKSNLNNNKKENNKKDTLNNKLFNTPEIESKKPKKKNLYSKCSDYIVQYTNNIPLQDALHRFLDLRLEIAKNEGKPFYYNMWPSIVNDLDKYDVDMAIKVVEQSIQKGWKRFYEIKDYSQKSSIKSADYEKNVGSDKHKKLDLTDEVY